jgi:outer membrane protein
MTRTTDMKKHAFAVAAVSCILAGPAAAAEKPLWELGAGLSVLRFPDYRGSDRSDNYAVPFPYFVYRGEFLKADKDGIRGTLFNSDRIDLNISVGASLPVKSDDNTARQGMPNLKPTLEIGPSLDLTLWRTDDHRYKLDLRLPVRTAFTAEAGMHDIGWVFSPRLNLDVRDALGLPGWNLGLLAGPMYGSDRNHQYFYSVAPQYATVARPAYEARGGYAGSQFLVAVSKRYERYWVGAFARWDTLKGAVFADSPLVKRDSYFAAGVGVAWILGQSSKMVETDE